MRPFAQDNAIAKNANHLDSIQAFALAQNMLNGGTKVIHNGLALTGDILPVGKERSGKPEPRGKRTGFRRGQLFIFFSGSTA